MRNGGEARSWNEKGVRAVVECGEVGNEVEYGQQTMGWSGTGNGMAAMVYDGIRHEMEWKKYIITNIPCDEPWVVRASKYVGTSLPYARMHEYIDTCHARLKQHQLRHLARLNDISMYTMSIVYQL